MSERAVHVWKGREEELERHGMTLIENLSHVVSRWFSQNGNLDQETKLACSSTFPRGYALPLLSRWTAAARILVTAVLSRWRRKEVPVRCKERGHVVMLQLLDLDGNLCGEGNYLRLMVSLLLASVWVRHVNSSRRSSFYSDDRNWPSDAK